LSLYLAPFLSLSPSLSLSCCSHTQTSSSVSFFVLVPVPLSLWGKRGTLSLRGVGVVERRRVQVSLYLSLSPSRPLSLSCSLPLSCCISLALSLSLSLCLRFWCGEILMEMRSVAATGLIDCVVQVREQAAEEGWGVDFISVWFDIVWKTVLAPVLEAGPSNHVIKLTFEVNQGPSTAFYGCEEERQRRERVLISSWFDLICFGRDRRLHSTAARRRGSGWRGCGRRRRGVLPSWNLDQHDQLILAVKP